MARDAQYFLSQTLADVARYAATLSASLEQATEQLAELTAERDALKAQIVKAAEPPPA